MIIELDSLIAYVNRRDKYHKVISKFFERIAAGELKNVKVAASAYLEYSLLLRSRGYGEDDIREDLLLFKDFPNLDEAPLTLEVLIKASELREMYNLSFFDSLHAATALLFDGVIASIDKVYTSIKNLKTVLPTEI
ncbi:MAG: PIN domain-containing protein [archaeon GBS-70-058]|nr:PIN domain-containing protein [Candidatus Culexarchaeum nevadense]